MYYVGTRQFNSYNDASRYVRDNGVTVTTTPSAPSETISGGMLTNPNTGTTGGVTHATITCTAISSTKWSVSVITGGTGNLATPFSAAVS